MQTTHTHTPIPTRWAPHRAKSRHQVPESAADLVPTLAHLRNAVALNSSSYKPNDSRGACTYPFYIPLGANDPKALLMFIPLSPKRVLGPKPGKPKGYEQGALPADWGTPRSSGPRAWMVMTSLGIARKAPWQEQSMPCDLFDFSVLPRRGPTQISNYVPR